MRFAFSEDQAELKRGARRFLATASSSERVRAAMATERGWDADVWTRIATELGWTALAIPEVYGGMAFGFVEIAAVMEEAGRALLCAPFLSTVCLAASAIVAGGSDATKRALLPRIADGSATATLAFSGKVSARRDHDGVVIDGAARHVLDGHSAAIILVVATLDGRDEIVVDGDARGVSRKALPTMDATRKQTELGFEAARGSLLGDAGTGARTLAVALDHARVALAAEQVGAAERCLEMALEYAKTREQFGRPIGSFQAIKHKLADVFVRVESARSAAYHAAWIAAHRPEELATAAAMAKAYCSEAFFHAASESVQIHGGIGFTWEHDAHLFFKRARASEALFGDPSTMRERISDVILSADGPKDPSSHGAGPPPRSG